MKFEERVAVLCAQALAADDEVQVRKILRELRLVLHQHIEDLRSGLLIAYTTMIRPNSADDVPQQPGIAPTADNATPQPAGVPRTWQQVVHEMACERDHGRMLQLSLELNRLLQRHSETASQS
jgi:hypothetical protein